MLDQVTYAKESIYSIYLVGSILKNRIYGLTYESMANITELVVVRRKF